MRSRGVRGLNRAFVGREVELAQLQSTYRTVADGGKSHLLTILGDPGVGQDQVAAGAVGVAG